MTQKDELHTLRNNVVNKALVIGFVFGIVSYIVTILRTLSYGIDGAFFLITAVMFILGMAVIYRKRLSLNLKVYSIMLFVLMAMISGLVKFGFLVSSKAYIILIPIFVSFILEYRRALLLLLFYVGVYSLFGYCFVTGIIPLSIDANQYILSANAWLMDLSIIFLTALTLLVVGRQYSNTILEKLSVIKKNNKDLSEREKEYRVLFEHSFDAIIILKDGLYYEANERALDMFKCDMDYLIGRSPKVTSPPFQPDGLSSEIKAKQKIESAMSGEPQLFDWQHIRADGEIFDASISLVPIKYDDKEFLQAILHDITEEKQQQVELEKYRSHLENLVKVRTEELEVTNEELTQSNTDLINKRNALEKTLSELHQMQQKLIESEKMASIGVLTSGVAHEINNPLNFIQSGLYGLKSLSTEQYKGAGAEELELLRSDIIEDMEEGVQRISDIISSLHHFNSNNSKSQSCCNLHVVIDNCLKMLAHHTKGKITINKTYLNKELMVKGNEGELHQMILNVLYNSVQAISGKGNIDLKTDCIEDKAIIEIKDDGVGMDEEVVNRIFDPFYTTKETGSGVGLGLSIVYNIIKKHKGDIKVDSKKNVGSKFSLSIPI